MISASVSRIMLYPIKSLDGVPVEKATFLESGALRYDREFCLCDADGRWINGKREARLNLIRAEYDLAAYKVRLKSPGQDEWQEFNMLEEPRRVEGWFAENLGMPVSFKRNNECGFPDDTHALGPTLISNATLGEVGGWFNITDASEVVRRFRTNIELLVDIPFWEDQLFGPPRSEVSFSVGEAALYGVGPCKRCIVPVRDSHTGEETPDFQVTFSARRATALPIWSNRLRFGPLLYRLGVNTRVERSQYGKQISLGDTCEVPSATEKTES